MDRHNIALASWNHISIANYFPYELEKASKKEIAKNVTQVMNEHHSDEVKVGVIGFVLDNGIVSFPSYLKKTICLLKKMLDSYDHLIQFENPEDRRCQIKIEIIMVQNALEKIKGLPINHVRAAMYYDWTKIDKYYL